MKFFLISLCIVSAVVSATSDYCQLGCYQYYSGRTEKNIGCLDAASKTAMAKCSATVEVLNEAMKTEIVNAHNERRNRLALGKLPGFKPACQMATMQWSDDLAQLADIYIRSCIDGHDKCHKTKDFEFAGQNLFWISYMPEADNQFVNKFVDAWYSEYKACIQQYTNCYPSGYHPRSQSQMIGHFTVMMNEKNTHVGCSIGRINGETNVVCNYASTNMINNPIYKPCAKPAEKCETGQNPLFPGLCSKRESYKVNEFNNEC